MFGLMFFPDRARGYRELARVLEPGGVAVVSSWAAVEDSPLMRLMFGALQAADPSFPSPRRDVAGLENPEVLQSEMAAGGFDDVIVHQVTHEVSGLDADELWERMVRSSAPLLMLRKRLGEDEWERRGQVALRFIAEEITKAPRLSTTAHVAIGHKGNS